jgi:hypothetical protein
MMVTITKTTVESAANWVESNLCFEAIRAVHAFPVMKRVHKIAKLIGTIGEVCSIAWLSFESELDELESDDNAIKSMQVTRKVIPTICFIRIGSLYR